MNVNDLIVFLQRAVAANPELGHAPVCTLTESGEVGPSIDGVWVLQPEELDGNVPAERLAELREEWVNVPGLVCL